MKFNSAILVIIFFSGLSSFAQDATVYGYLNGDTAQTPIDSLNYLWKKSIVYSLDSNELWVADRIGNIYTSSNGVLSKYDTTGVLKFSQSVKSMGETKQMLPVNSMKLIHFSEEQQTLCYFDNTLTRYNDCLELSQMDIVNASFVSYSGRSDMVWVYDDVNSKLVLLSLSGNQQNNQKIENLNGILDVTNIVQIIELENKLYIVDNEKGVYIFDLYGSLIEYREEKGLKCIYVKDGLMIMLLEGSLKIENMKLNESYTFPLPVKEVEFFQPAGEHFFFRTSQHVHKFLLQIAK